MKIHQYKLRIFLTILTCFILTSNLAGQDSQDEWLWSGLGTKMKLSKKWRVDLEQQVRFNDKFTSYDYTFTELGLNYSPIKHFRFNFNYRNMHYDRGLRHRYALEAHVNFQPKGSKFYFHIRERFQSFVWNDDNSSISNIRNLGTIGYKINKWSKVYTTQEWFFRLDNFNQIKTYRGTLGVNWNFTDKLMLMTYYSFQRTLNSEAVRKIHIVGLRGFYKLDLRRKTKGNP